MTPREVLAKWRAEQRRFEALGALVDGAKLIGQLLHDIEAAEATEAAEIVPLAEAAEVSGYTSGHLSRLIREGRLANAGKRNSPALRRADLPRKPASLRSPQSRLKLLGAGPGQVARAIVTAQRGAA